MYIVDEWNKDILWKIMIWTNLNFPWEKNDIAIVS